jgi:hypothetical protein
VAQLRILLKNKQFADAIIMSLRIYVINSENVRGQPRFDPRWSTSPAITTPDGVISLGPKAFLSPSVLATTLVHEITHANQAAFLRRMNGVSWSWSPAGSAQEAFDETVALQAELQARTNTGLRGQALANVRFTQNQQLRNIPPAARDLWLAGLYTA